MNIKRFETPAAINETLAKDIVGLANNTIASKGRFNFVLTGGSSPKALYQLLATVYKNTVDWQKVYFFFGDERYVPQTDPDYNGLMAKSTLLDPLEIPDENIFYVNTHLSPEVAAAKYYASIANHFKNEEIVFDLVLLGMGNDAHTASMFPQTTILESQVATIEAVYVAKLESWRISFTAKLINRAANIYFLVFGSGKAEALKHVMAEAGNPLDYPSRLISDKAVWYVDAAASEGL